MPMPRLPYVIVLPVTVSVDDAYIAPVTDRVESIVDEAPTMIPTDDVGVIAS